ncbi:MAG: hypothetical protein CM15mP83_5130 [Flavobacteriaceae bacterium]|nr:MAG: hypothetical protein CM15mP83_5130 [Flavobacteriaceae bacterium]
MSTAILASRLHQKKQNPPAKSSPFSSLICMVFLALDFNNPNPIDTMVNVPINSASIEFYVILKLYK